MGDWRSKADAVRNENRRCGEETVPDASKTQKDSVKDSFCEQNYCALLTGGPLMGDPILDNNRRTSKSPLLVLTGGWFGGTMTS